MRFEDHRRNQQSDRGGCRREQDQGHRPVHQKLRPIGVGEWNEESVDGEFDRQQGDIERIALGEAATGTAMTPSAATARKPNFMVFLPKDLPVGVLAGALEYERKHRSCKSACRIYTIPG